MRKYLAALIIGLVVGAFAMQKLCKPSIRTEVKTNVVTQTRIVHQKHTIVLPNGTTETTETTTDNSVRTLQQSEVTLKLERANYLVGLSAGTKIDFMPRYGASVQLRVLGPVYVGLYGRTDGEFGLLMSMEF